MPPKCSTWAVNLAVVVDRAENLQAVAHPGHVVVVAMTRRRVNAAGSLVERDIVRQHQQRLPIEVGMAGLAPFYGTPVKAPGDYRIFPTAFLGNRVEQARVATMYPRPLTRTPQYSKSG